MRIPKFIQRGDQAWEKASVETRQEALGRAAWILGSLSHYSSGEDFEADDTERLAAELLRWRAEEAKRFLTIFWVIVGFLFFGWLIGSWNAVPRDDPAQAVLSRKMVVCTDQWRDSKRRDVSYRSEYVVTC